MSLPPTRWHTWLWILACFLIALCGVRAGAAGAESHSAKKGIGITTRNEAWAERVGALNVSWFYTWGASLPKEPPGHVRFVPMIWGYGDRRTPPALARLTAEKRAGKWDTLLGFNEPDGKDQANLTVDQAIEAWPRLMETGLRLGSPACVHGDDDWMREFMKRAAEKHYRVDFVTMHDYGGADAKSFLERVEKVHKLYDRPIWITEFAVADWSVHKAGGKPNRHSPEAVYRFMKEVLPALEKQPYVERYAWFTATEDADTPLGTSALFKPDGSLTTLGELYAEY